MSHTPSTKQSPYILSRDAIEAMPGTAKVHFLNPNGRRLNKSLGDATGLTGLGFHLIEVPVGAESTEHHRHLFEDECVYVLSGRAHVTLDEETFEVGEGDFIGLPAGGPAHVFSNPGPEPLRCLVVGQRLTHDVGDYPRLGKRLYRNGEAWDLVDLAHIVDPKAAPGATPGKK
ncbi:MAG: cupin domain-containing protein [Polyangiales bacterium]|nr:cupin domain-containing protein [Myxococcales bacterium]